MKSSDTFIDRLLTEARSHKSVKRLFISTREIRTEPEGARYDGWPAAWAIAEKAGVSWGCGNPGQHQIRVTEPEVDRALPKDFLRRRKAREAARERLDLAREAFDQAKEIAVQAWLTTNEGQVLADAVTQAGRGAEACWQAVWDAQPGWYRQGEWFKVKE